MGIVPENNYGYQVIERETIVNSAEANDNINSLINSLHPDVRMYLDLCGR